jgi:hypothetical protein
MLIHLFGVCGCFRTKIFTVWSLSEQDCQPLTYMILLHGPLEPKVCDTVVHSVARDVREG